jgi:hypothetical protein
VRDGREGLRRIATALQTATGTSLSVSAYMVAVGLTSLTAVAAVQETHTPIPA